jgi:hypothetical protein
MAEDQGVNGTIWNKEANAILSWFGWETIGDIDMDIVGDDGRTYGIDTFIKIGSPLSNLPLSAILEAKCYATKSFSQATLQNWVNILDKKLSKLKFSGDLQAKFPIIDDCKSMNLGIIVIWFHDTTNYPLFQNKFKEALNNLKVSNRPKMSGGYNKILIIDNEVITKLCSLHTAITSSKSLQNKEISFFYPSILRDGKATVRKKLLSPEYVFSKVILAEAKGSNDDSENVVFYFGNTGLDSFKQLRDQLSKYSVLDEQKKLVLFIYYSNNEFRKIKPELEKIFDDTKELSIEFMDNVTDLPGEIKTIGNE